MIICPNCKRENVEGTFFCDDCGQILSSEHAAILATRQIKPATNELPIKSSLGTARLGVATSIIIRVQDAPNSITLQPKPQSEITLGRADPTTGATPGLDLTPFGALEKGVSRLHAIIARDNETLTLLDKGSSNGTFLNGQRLVANQPRVLRDGDEIRLGRLICHVYFK